MFRFDVIVFSVVVLAVAVLAIPQGVGVKQAKQPRVWKSKPSTRVIPADVLRDFQTQCFASTSCKTYALNETWSLKPFCGQATCMAQQVEKDKYIFLEKVEDCGPLPTVVPAPEPETTKCRVEESLFDKEAKYPHCCPVYTCEDPYVLEFPSLEGDGELPAPPPLEVARRNQKKA